MKKILAIMALAVTGLAFAGDTVTLEGQHVNNVGSNAQQTYVLGVKKEINSNFAADVAFSNTQTENTNALTTRLEAGGTVTAPIYGIVNGYTRVALGQKYSNTTSFTYYSVEPGVTVPFGPLTAKVGWRYRTADDSGTNNDQTHTMRYGVSYAVTKLDTVGVRYDRVKGDSDQKVWVVNYSRGF